MLPISRIALRKEIYKQRQRRDEMYGFDPTLRGEAAKNGAPEGVGSAKEDFGYKYLSAIGAVASWAGGSAGMPFLNICLIPRNAWRVRSSFSISENRT